MLSRDENDPDGALEEKTVTAVEAHTVYALREVVVQLADGSTVTISTTDSHPFYVEGQGWITAGNLYAGARLESPDGQVMTVVSTTVIEKPEGVNVYNFTVEGNHTYFVDAPGGAVDAVWVHNSCGRRGGILHQATVSLVEASLKARGFVHVAGGSLPEMAATLLKSGKTKLRYADLVFRNAKGELIAVQIGRREMRSGFPSYGNAWQWLT